jgi:hypothetical protein
MDLEETEASNDCTGEGQQQFNRPTDREGTSRQRGCYTKTITVIVQLAKKEKDLWS